MSGRPLDVQNTADAKNKMNDAKVVGNPDAWQLVGKHIEPEKDYMETFKVLECKTGCIAQIELKMGNELAQALVFVPGGTWEMFNQAPVGWRKILCRFDSEGHSITKETSVCPIYKEDPFKGLVGTLVRSRTIEKGRLSVGLSFMPGENLLQIHGEEE